jgi:hypothetical protein
MDETVAKHPKKCRKRVEKRKLWKKNYYALMLAMNPDNLFEIVKTREMFFRRFEYLDIYVFGLAVSYEKALELLRAMMEEASREEVFEPKNLFDKKDFS